MQGAGVAELLEALDDLREKHEVMEATEFNDDGTYKAGINQVQRVACYDSRRQYGLCAEGKRGSRNAQGKLACPAKQGP